MAGLWALNLVKQTALATYSLTGLRVRDNIGEGKGGVRRVWRYIMYGSCVLRTTGVSEGRVLSHAF